MRNQEFDPTAMSPNELVRLGVDRGYQTAVAALLDVFNGGETFSACDATNTPCEHGDCQLAAVVLYARRHYFAEKSAETFERAYPALAKHLSDAVRRTESDDASQS